MPPVIADVFAAAADRYVDTTIGAWEFARGKLTRRRCLRGPVTPPIPPGQTCVDIGCGQGLTLAAFIEARRQYQTVAWPLPPRRFSRAWSESSVRRAAAAIARDALGGDADITQARAPEGLPVVLDSVTDRRPPHDARRGPGVAPHVPFARGCRTVAYCSFARPCRCGVGFGRSDSEPPHGDSFRHIGTGLSLPRAREWRDVFQRLGGP